MVSFSNLAGRLGSPRFQRVAPLLLMLVALVVLLPGSGTIPLLDRDEPRFAQATREMMARDDWVVPYFNGQYRFDKPVLIYWLMRLSYLAFGVNELSARLPSVLCAAAMAWLLWHMGRRWFSAACGVFAGFGFITCVQLLQHGRGALADMPMILGVAVAHYALFELLHAERPEHSRRWFLLLYGALGVGFLAKGPIAMVTPLLTVLLHRFAFWRQPLRWRNLRLGLGLPLLLLIIAAWGIPAVLRTHGLFFRIGIGEHVVERGYKTFQGHGGFLFYYLLTALLSLFPWIAFAGSGAAAVRRNWNSRNAFLVSWLAGTYLLFSFYTTKLPHYVMPAFPAFFLIIGQLAQPQVTMPRWTCVWFWAVLLLGALIAGAVLVEAFRIPAGESYSPLRGALAGAGCIILALIALAVLWRFGSVSASVAPLLVMAVSMVWLANGLRAVTPALRLQRLFQQMPADTAYGGYRFMEPSLVFYTNHQWQPLGSVEKLKEFMAEPGPRLVVCTEQEIGLSDHFRWRWRSAQEKPEGVSRAAELAQISTDGYQESVVGGIEVANSRWVTLRVYHRP
jgi:4-amino-4-deoxy-L-arabinose transferase-like glycosyltransferase